MDFIKMFKRQTLIITISIIGLSVILLGTSYALFFRTNQSTENQVLSTGTLNVEFQNPSASITADLYPKFASEVGNADTYNFTVRNTGTLPMIYELTISNDAESSNSNALNHDYLMISFDGGAPTILSSLPRTADTASETNQNNIKYVLLADDTLAATGNANSSKQHNVKIWMIPDTPVEYSGKTVNLEVSANGVVDKSNS